jgi:cytochrome-b5 reductase
MRSSIVQMDKITCIKTTMPSPFPLTAICINTHDTKTFRLGFLPMPPWIYFPAIPLYVHATINGKSVKRPPTLSSLQGAAGFFDLTVKCYEAGVMSKYLHEQRVDDTVLMSGSR